MKVAIDYDDTYTLDKSVWKSLVLFLVGSGADVRFVTYRFSSNDNSDIKSDSDDLGIPVIFCNGKQKSHVTTEIDWEPDIWIDDSPETIVSLKDMKGFTKGCIVNNDLGEEESVGDKNRYEYFSVYKNTGKY